MLACLFIYLFGGLPFFFFDLIDLNIVINKQLNMENGTFHWQNQHNIEANKTFMKFIFGIAHSSIIVKSEKTYHQIQFLLCLWEILKLLQYLDRPFFNTRSIQIGRHFRWISLKYLKWNWKIISIKKMKLTFTIDSWLWYLLLKKKINRYDWTQ